MSNYVEELLSFSLKFSSPEVTKKATKKRQNFHGLKTFYFRKKIVEILVLLTSFSQASEVAKFDVF